MKALFPAILPLSFGILCLQRPYFEFNGQQIIIPALWGPLKKTYIVEQAEDLKIIQNRIYLRQQKIRVYQWLANPSDWQYFLAFIQETKRVSSS